MIFLESISSSYSFLFAVAKIWIVGPEYGLATGYQIEPSHPTSKQEKSQNHPLVSKDHPQATKVVPVGQKSPDGSVAGLQQWDVQQAVQAT